MYAIQHLANGPVKWVDMDSLKEHCASFSRRGRYQPLLHDCAKVPSLLFSPGRCQLWRRKCRHMLATGRGNTRHAILDLEGESYRDSEEEASHVSWGGENAGGMSRKWQKLIKQVGKLKRLGAPEMPTCTSS